jgi:methyl-accepting chemotaxis protein
MIKNQNKFITSKKFFTAYIFVNFCMLSGIFLFYPASFYSISTGFLVCSSIIASLLIVRLVKLIEDLKNSLKQLATSFQKIKVPFYPANSEFSDLFSTISEIGYNLEAINRTQSVIQFELDGTIIGANKIFLDVMGYDLHQIQGKHHSMFAYGNFAQTAEYQEFWQKLRSGQFVQAEFLRKKSNGDKIWLSAFYIPILDTNGKPIRVVKFATDITQEVNVREKQAKQAQEFELLALVASETDNLVVITDAHEKIEYVNKGFTKLTGYTADEAIGKKQSFLYGSETSQETIAKIREKLELKQPFYDEILNYSKNGKPYWVSLSANPVFDKNGNLVRFIFIQGDITSQKHARLENEKGQQETIKILNGLSNGNLTCKMTGDYHGTFLNIKNSLNETIDRLSVITGDILNASGNINLESKSVLDASDNLSGRTEAQAATLEEINATMTQVNSTVIKNSELASKSSQFAGGVRQTALNGGEVLKNLVKSMSDISESSERIVDIIGLIDTIASQTNLLALNAAVEAARAGEAGHGFAVVASEVRTLAGRAADASSDIRKLIIENATRINSGSSLADTAGASLKEIVESVSLLADQVNDIHKATTEQTTSIREISSALSSLDKATQQNSQMANQTSGIAKKLQNLGNELDNHVNFFKKGNQQSHYYKDVI